MRPTGLGITMFVVWAVGVAAAAAGPQDDDYAAARERMVTDDIAAGGVSDPRVLESLRTLRSGPGRISTWPCRSANHRRSPARSWLRR